MTKHFRHLRPPANRPASAAFLFKYDKLFTAERRTIRQLRCVGFFGLVQPRRTHVKWEVDLKNLHSGGTGGTAIVYLVAYLYSRSDR